MAWFLLVDTDRLGRGYDRSCWLQPEAVGQKAVYSLPGVPRIRPESVYVHDSEITLVEMWGFSQANESQWIWDKIKTPLPSGNQRELHRQDTIWGQISISFGIYRDVARVREVLKGLKIHEVFQSWSHMSMHFHHYIHLPSDTHIQAGVCACTHMDTHIHTAATSRIFPL